MTRPILQYDPVRCRVWVPEAPPAARPAAGPVLMRLAAAGVLARLLALAGARASRPRR